MTNVTDNFFSILAGAISKLPETDQKVLSENAVKLKKIPDLHPDILGLVETIEHSRPPFLHKKPPKD